MSASPHLPTTHDCADIHELAVAWVDGLLRGEVRARVDAHVAECARCRESLSRDAALRRRLRRIAPERAPEALRALLEGSRHRRQ